MALEVSTPPSAGKAGAERAAATSNDRLQQLVDESATFHLLVTPDRRRSSTMLRAAAGAGTGGFEATEAIRRLKLTLDRPSTAGVAGQNQVGAQVGDVHLRWVVTDRGTVARPERGAPSAALDRSRSQRFVMEEATFRFASGDAFRSFGTGRTFPIATDDGRVVLLVGAVGNIVEGAGCFRDRPGNFTLSGEVGEDGFFTGHVMVRVMDLDRSLRANEIASPQDTGEGEDGITYLTWIAQKRQGGSHQENTFSLTTQGQARGVNIPVDLMRVWTDFSVDRGFRATGLRTGEVIGLEIGFGKEARERTPLMGTPLTPFQFEGVSRYSFYDPNGNTVGTLTANVLEGRSIRVQFPSAPAAPALRFGYFGPLVTGSGCFSGVSGMLYGTAGSVFAPPPAPHIISNLYVARLFDKEGRWRSRTPDGEPHPRVPAPKARRPDPTFLPLLDKLDAYADTHKAWRAGVKSCADRFARVIAADYNRHRHMGEFTGWQVDEDKLREIFEAGGVKAFDETVFNRYAGRAKGVFRTYTFEDHDEVNSAPLYSYWDPINFTRADGRIYKQIVGSNTAYHMPDRLPPLSEGTVDLLANSWRADVGVVSYIDIHQQRRHLRTSFAYRLPGPYEILWFVKDLWIDGQEIRNNVFMASHEWKERLNGRMCYLMVAMFYEMDFESRDIQLHGDTFWRVRYEEE